MKVSATLALVGTMIVGAVASPIEERQNVPRGPVIYSCTKPNTVALTFDDGPHLYTEHVVDLLDAGGHKGTFFINGDNFGTTIYQFTPLLKRMRETRHQIASHTWGHIDLAATSTAAAREDILKLETELRKTIGYWPTYFRPPFLNYPASAQTLLGGLGYRVISTDIDTKDYEGNVAAAMTNLRNGLNRGGSIVLMHDVWELTAKTLLPQVLAELTRRGLKSVTVGECLGEEYAYWYRVNPR